MSIVSFRLQVDQYDAAGSSYSIRNHQFLTNGYKQRFISIDYTLGRYQALWVGYVAHRDQLHEITIYSK